MSENKQPTEQPYIVEKIVPNKRGKRRYILNFIFGAIAAAVFGVIACLAFVFVYPYVQNRVNPPQPAPQETISLPKHTEPEENTTDPEPTLSQETVTEAAGDGLDSASKQWIREQINKLGLELSPQLQDLNAYTKEMIKLYTKVEKSLVAITTKEDTEVLFGSKDRELSGIVIAKTPETRKVYILTEFGVITKNNLCVRFSGSDTYYEAELSGMDSILDLCVLTVTFEEEQDKEFKAIPAIEMGNGYLLRQGSVVMAVGSPYAVNGTMAYGNLVTIAKDQTTYDTQYRMFYTNIHAPQAAKGFLINLDGQLIGVLNSSYRKTELKDYLSAIGTDEISDFINHMANGVTYSYCGVLGQTITQAISEKTGIPQGVYVTDVQNGGPAYEAGIMSGDIITAVSTMPITKYSQLADALLNRHLPGESVIITIMRQGKTEYKQMEITVKLGVRR